MKKLIPLLAVIFSPVFAVAGDNIILPEPMVLEYNFAKEFNAFKKIEFTKKGITPTQYYIHEDGKSIVADVNNSSSFLVTAFPEPINVDAIRVYWRHFGDQKNVTSKEMEQTSEGDDFHIRIGLVLKNSKTNDVFDSVWWAQSFGKSLAKLGKREWHKELLSTFSEYGHELRRGIMVVPGALSDHAETWTTGFPGLLMASAYSKQMPNSNDQVSQLLLDDIQATENFDDWCPNYDSNGCEVIGLWIMADGDDSNSKFQKQLEKIELRFKE